MKYSEKLKDPRWQKKRLEILDRDRWNCRKCGDDKSTLHVHHRRYIPGRDPWDYPDTMLTTLCELCHSTEREEWNEYSTSIIEQLQDKFFGDDLRELAYGINSFEPLMGSGIMSQIYSWAFRTPEVQQHLIDKYFEWCKEVSRQQGRHTPSEIENAIKIIGKKENQ